MFLALAAAFFFDVLTTVIRYLAIAWFPNKKIASVKAFKKIETDIPSNEKFEFKTSMIAIIFIGVVDTVFYYFIMAGKTKVYFNFSDYPVWFYCLNFVILFVLHDLYFYITHRILHTPYLYKKVHYAHHMSKSPTSLAAYSFHPVEAIVQSFLFPVIFIWPFHMSNLGIFFFVSLIYNSYGHSGYEFKDTRNLKPTHIGYWLNTSIFHFAHHQKNNGNFGLYTRVWDILFKTSSDVSKLRIRE